MLCVLLFHEGNHDQAIQWCQTVKKLGGARDHSIMLATDGGDELFPPLDEALDGCFDSITHYRTHEQVDGWPMRENVLHKHAVMAGFLMHKKAWLRMEPDSTPLVSGWLDEIECAYKACGKPIMEGVPENPARFCGCAVFPANACELSFGMMEPTSVWYADGAAQLRQFSAKSNLMSETPQGNYPCVAVRDKTLGASGDGDRTCIVQLGRIGDILNILPLVRHISETEGRPILMVHEDYKDIEVDYCDLLVWNKGAWSDLDPAVRFAKSKFKRVIVSQIHGSRWQGERKCASFCIESWLQAGYEQEWGKHGLTFSPPHYLSDKSIPHDSILVNAKGFSSPFAKAGELMDLLGTLNRPIIDLSTLKLPRIQDLLHYYANAACLVTIDTATLHLAAASQIPVVAIVSDSPTKWHMSPQKGNEILRVHYGDFDNKKDEIVSAVNSCFAPLPSVHHVYQVFDCDEQTKRRNDFAAQTWMDGCYEGVQEHQVPPSSLKRTSAIVGDDRNLSFIKDIIDAVDCNPEDVIVLTNTDTCLRRGFWRTAAMSDRPLYGHRYDFDRLTRPLDSTEIPTGGWYDGKDVFVFRKSWWEAHKAEFPDMLTGAEAWDKILAALIVLRGGCEVFGSCYHERHYATWQTNNVRGVKDKANKHNRFLARKWLHEHGMPLDELGRFIDGEFEGKTMNKNYTLADEDSLDDLPAAEKMKPKRTQKPKRSLAKEEWPAEEVDGACEPVEF